MTSIPVRMLVPAAVLAMAGCAGGLAEPNARDACVTAQAEDAGAIVSVPFEIVNGRVYVQARVNGGGPYTFAVDTGASGLGRADESLTRAIGLPAAGAGESSDGVSISTVKTVRVDSLQLGGLERTNLEVMSRDYSSTAGPGAEISGIIGRDFFADGLLVIDFPARRLSFSRSREFEAGNANVLSYERPFRVPVTIAGKTFEGNLDTGAAVAIVMPPDVYEQVASAPLEAAGGVRLTNTVIESGKALIDGPVQVGQASVSRVETRVAERFPELFVGGHVLQNYVVAFDQRTKLAAVCLPGK